MATLDEQIAEAKQAQHDLAIGKSVRVVVDQNGERVEFTAASLSRLDAYIAKLESKKTGSTGASGPLGFFF